MIAIGQELDDLNARPTDRGMVLPLGDVRFATAAFLNSYPKRTVAVEGYTDSVRSEDYNLRLSQRRADSVKSFLTGQGSSATRLTTSGKGEIDPVAGNDSATGRQQSRRVEVVIATAPTASR